MEGGRRPIFKLTVGKVIFGGLNANPTFKPIFGRVMRGGRKPSFNERDGSLMAGGLRPIFKLAVGRVIFGGLRASDNFAVGSPIFGGLSDSDAIFQRLSFRKEVTAGRIKIPAPGRRRFRS